MKPRYLIHMFALANALLIIFISVAPLFGIEATNANLNLFNGLNVLLLGTACFLLFYVIRAENLHEKADEKAREISDNYDELLANERESKRRYKLRLSVLREHQDKFPDPYRDYLCNVLANGSISPTAPPPKARTATVYREDHSPYGWYRLLVELGLIEFNDDCEDGNHPADVLQGEDLEIYKDRSEVQVAFAERVDQIKQEPKLV